MTAFVHTSPPTLHFPAQPGAAGFISESVEDISKNDLEIMTRELLQNATDEGASRVKVELVYIAPSEIPDCQAYKHALKAAQQARASSDVTPAEKRIVKDIEAMLKKKHIPVLLFCDNGKGIPPAGMTALMWAGNSTKASSSHSGGSFGVGNRTTLKHSVLRYVGFVSRYRQDNGTLQDICAGRTVLAAHSGSDNLTRSGEGLLVYDINTKSIDEPAIFSEPDPNGVMSDWLRKHVADGDTGSIVAVFGFTPRSKTEWVETICRSAAKNFYEAFHDGSLSVNVETPKLSDKVTPSNIREKMLDMESSKRHPGQGLSSGSLASSGYKTFAGGEVVLDDKNSTVRVRRWGPEERGTNPPNEVSLSRNRMWIARGKEIPECGNFAGIKPFNAVISAKPNSPLYRLLIAAEGPKHIGLPSFPAMDKASKDHLEQILADIASRIRTHVGDMEDTEEWAPPGFAVIEGKKTRAAEKLSDSPQPQETDDDDDDEEEETENEESIVDDDNEDSGGDDQVVPPEIPKGLELSGATLSVFPIAQQGEPAKLIARIKCGDGISPPELFGVWVCWRTGSDASCDKWIQTRYLDIKEIDWESETGKKTGGKACPEHGKSREVMVPGARSVLMVIALEDEIPEEIAKALTIKAMRKEKTKEAAENE